MLTTRYAIILLARSDARGLARFPGGTTDIPGFFVEPDPHITLSKQIPRFTALELGEPELASFITLEQILSPLLMIPGHGEATLLFCHCAKPWSGPTTLPTLPELLRAMPKSRNRIAYNKAFQHLMGAAQETLSILEIDGPLPLK